MNGEASGWVVFTLMVGIAVVVVELAVAMVVLSFKDARAATWRETVFGSQEKGR